MNSLCYAYFIFLLNCKQYNKYFLHKIEIILKLFMLYDIIAMNIRGKSIYSSRGSNNGSIIWN